MNKADSRVSIGQLLAMFLGTSLGVALALIMETYSNQILGWFIGGCIIGISATLSFVRKEKRSTAKRISVIILSGVVAAAGNYLLSVAPWF